ncbi:MAG: putative bifunctional diguanylate cyclase/phosphodiesterase [Acidimicrobiales bacterium]
MFEHLDLDLAPAPAVLDLIPFGVVVCTLEGRIDSVNRAATDLLGVDATTRSCWELLDLPGGHAPHVDRARRSAAAGRVSSVEVTGRVVRSLGVTIPVSVSMRSLPGDPSRLVLALRRLGEELHQAVRLRAFEERFEQLATSVPTGILSSEFGMRVSYANDRSAEIFGVCAEDLLGFGWLDHLVDEDAAAVEDVLATVLDDASERRLVVRITPPSGGIRHADLRLAPVSSGAGRDIGFVITIDDVTEHRELNEQLVVQSLHDPLTGLPNRTALWETLDHAIREDRGHPAVLFVDLDDFKDVNDSLGHTAGDELLVVVADRLRACARSSDTVIRFGGDEFVLVLREVPDHEVVDRVAGRVLHAISQPMHLSEQDTVITASVGIVWPEEAATGVDVEGLIRDADIALFHAKRNGKNRIEHFDLQLRAGAQRRIGIAAALRRAIEQESPELTVHFQPIVDLANRRVVALEALARWTHPELGPVPPDDFIPVAEETGLITKLACRMLDLALAPMSTWRQLPGCQDLVVSVNLSARDLTEPLIADHVAAALATHDLPGRALQIELTESAVMTDPDRSLGTLGTLKDLGPSVAIDDFGTGYSSLAYLHRLPVDTIKIDREFVAGLQGHSLAMIEAIVALAGSLGLPVVAEGVETDEQAAILASIGVPLAQGYLYSRPVPPGEITALIELLAGPTLR